LIGINIFGRSNNESFKGVRQFCKEVKEIQKHQYHGADQKDMLRFSVPNFILKQIFVDLCVNFSVLFVVKILTAEHAKDKDSRKAE